MIRLLGLLIAFATLFVVAEPQGPTLEEELTDPVDAFVKILIDEGLANGSYPPLIAAGVLNQFLKVQIETFIRDLIGAELYDLVANQLIPFIAEKTSNAEKGILNALAPKPSAVTGDQLGPVLPAKRVPTAPSLIEAKITGGGERKYSVKISGTTFVISANESYTLERSESENAENWTVLISKLKELSHVDSEVEPGKTYFYRFVSENPDGKSLPSVLAKISIPKVELKIQESDVLFSKKEKSIEVKITLTTSVAARLSFECYFDGDKNLIRKNEDLLTVRVFSFEANPGIRFDCVAKAVDVYGNEVVKDVSFRVPLVELESAGSPPVENRAEGVNAFESEPDKLKPPAVIFTKNLKPGDIGEEVRAFQKFLNDNGFTVSGSGAGSPGNESDYFGSLTEQALIAFQDAFKTEILVPLGLKNGTGFFGFSTRNFVNNL